MSAFRLGPKIMKSKPQVTEADPVNFRTRTGQARRARTRSKILTAAFALFDKRGVDHVTVEDVREEAGLARGSFYNYFVTYEEMLKALAADIARQINTEQSERFESIPNMAERLWSYIRYTILRAASDRSCSEILVRITPLVGPLNEHMRMHAERELRTSIKRKVIDVPLPGVALDLGLGVATMMLKRALDSRLEPKELEAAGLMLMRAYGVPEVEARRISRLPLPELPDISLRTAIIQNFQAGS
jgi:AcrR family transcriptional regulator